MTCPTHTAKSMCRQYSCIVSLTYRQRLSHTTGWQTAAFPSTAGTKQGPWQHKVNESSGKRATKCTQEVAGGEGAFTSENKQMGL